MMKYCAYVATITGVIVLYYSIFARDAYAYLDPGTGSYLFQLLIATIIGGIYSIKLFWARITLFLRTHFSDRKDV